MPRKTSGRAVESLLRSIVSETVRMLRGSLPSQKQMQVMQKRLRSLDRRVSTLTRKSTRSVAGGKRRVGRPHKNPIHCKIRGCSGPARAKSLCSRHYQQRRRSAMRKK